MQRHSSAGFASLLLAGLRIATALLFRGYLSAFHRLRIVGGENLPQGRSFVMVANHASHLDMFCLLAALPVAERHRAFPVIAQDYFRRAWTLLAQWTINALPCNRWASDPRTILAWQDLLETSGNILLLFPEGTRSSASEPAEFRPGVAYLAAGRDLPVVPCHIAGSHRAWPKGRWFSRPVEVCLTIGEPRSYADLPPGKQGRQQLCHDLRAAVVALGSPDDLPADACRLHPAA